MQKTYSAQSPETIQSMFNDIANRYDRTNAILSGGLYRLWNKKLVKTMVQNRCLNLLDLCAGTGEIALGFLHKNPFGAAVLLDFSNQMLDVAKSKGEKFSNRVAYIEADAQKIPYDVDSFDGITIAYGIRNTKEPVRCIKESYRVLRKGGIFAILELTRPNIFPLRLLHSLFLKTAMPLIGKIVASNEEAYKYLCNSINSFISPKKLEEILLDTGFTQVTIHPLTGGIATLLVAKK